MTVFFSYLSMQQRRKIQNLRNSMLRTNLAVNHTFSNNYRYPHVSKNYDDYDPNVISPVIVFLKYLFFFHSRPLIPTIIYRQITKKIERLHHYEILRTTTIEHWATKNWTEIMTRLWKILDRVREACHTTNTQEDFLNREYRLTMEI